MPPEGYFEKYKDFEEKVNMFLSADICTPIEAYSNFSKSSFSNEELKARFQVKWN